MAPKIPVIAIVGRPNVGKSTLFNRILGRQQAIVEDLPGVTRDRNYAMIERFRVPFLLIDTGGFEVDPEGEIAKQVVEQTLLAAEEADVILAVFDGALGCQEGDRDVVQLLRRYNKQVYYIVNKCDGEEQGLRVADFYQLGIDTLYDCSALHGRRVNVLVETILESLPDYQKLLASAQARKERIAQAAAAAKRIADVHAEEEEFENAELSTSEDEEEQEYVEQEEEYQPRSFAPVFVPGESEQSAQEYEREHRILPLSMSEARDDGDVDEEPVYDFNAEEGPIEVPKLETIRVAIVGRPNVGKSTLLNTLTGEQRAITSAVAGTTRDTLDLKIRRDGQDFLLVDTAGMRRKSRVTDSVEHYSTLRSLRALSEADVAVVVIDAVEGATDQDVKIVGLAHEQGTGIVLAINKWDLVEKSHTTVHAFTKKLRESLKFAPYAPIVFVSALSGRRCPKIIEAVREVAHERMKRVSTHALNQTLQRALKRFAPPPFRGREIKLYYGVQVDVAPPRFSLFFNYPKALHFSFMRFLKNSVRDEFGFEGTDIKLMTRQR
ncbi:MAG: ribosome biogenesis GTPase Der [Bdellovibrionota bacterium]